MNRDSESPSERKAPVIPLSRYLRRRGREPEGDPFPPSPTPAAARRPAAPVFVEAISARAGGAPRVAADERAA